jgi:hypothetical protein
MSFQVDLDNPNPGTIFYFNEDTPDDGNITLRVCNGDALRKIEKKTTKKTEVFRRNQRFKDVEVDEDLQQELIWDYCIVDWVGVVDAKNTEIPCVQENKVRLMRFSPVFSAMVMKFLEALETTEVTRAKKLMKPSLSTPKD